MREGGGKRVGESYFWRSGGGARGLDGRGGILLIKC